MLKDFKEFVMRGNVMDLAVGVIIGAAFGKIVTSLTSDVILPAISLITGKLDFSNMFVTLSGQKMATVAEAKAAGAVTLNYGSFITNIVDFVIIAFVIFIMVRAMNRFRQPEPITTKACSRCKMSVAKHATRCPHCTSQLA